MMTILCGCLASVGWAIQGGAENRSDRLNVILLLVDALRADRLGCSGYPIEVSPAIDRLAMTGGQFALAFSQAPITQVSMPTIFTGLFPGVHDVIRGDDSLAYEFTTLTEDLERYDYHTACFTASAHVKNHFNFNQGFDLFEGSSTPDALTPANHLVDRALQWLEHRKPQPFFLYLHFMDVHTPLRLPEPYSGLFLDRDRFDLALRHVPALSDFQGPIDDEAAWSRHVFGNSRRIIQYNQAIRYVDREVSRLIYALKEQGIWDDTIIILTADHGEELLDHGRLGHGPILHNELIHVPLLIKPHSRGTGLLIDDAVQHVDILPTVADLTGVTHGEPTDGRSLLPLLTGRRMGPAAAFAQIMGRFHGLGPEKQWRYSDTIVEENWKLIRGIFLKPELDVERSVSSLPQFVEDRSLHGEVKMELYDLENDPQERRNVAGDRPEVVKALNERLARWQAACRERRESYEKRELTYMQPVELDETTRSWLESLGYLQ